MMVQRPSSAGDDIETFSFAGTGVETSEVESVMVLSLNSSNDIHFLSLVHAIIQQT